MEGIRVPGRLEGKIALITGSTSGCGHACAVRFAEEGARVMITGRNEQAGKDIVRSISEGGGTAGFFRADIGVEQEVSDLVDATIHSFGGLDILVNNAIPSELARGPDRADGSVTDITTEQFEAIWRPALYGYLWGCRFGIRQMIKQGRGGSVINVSSTTSLQSMANMDGYIAAKGAMNSTTRSMAVEYGQYGIRVNAVVLGLILTNDNSRAMAEHDVFGPRVRSHHLTRLGQPEDMANASLFLASDEASFVTGSSLVVDGGLTINSPLSTVFDRQS
jgi:3-oxoacyl-[acyl-carrier protein] reductase